MSSVEEFQFFNVECFGLEVNMKAFKILNRLQTWLFFFFLWLSCVSHFINVDLNWKIVPTSYGNHIRIYLVSISKSKAGCTIRICFVFSLTQIQTTLYYSEEHIHLKIK